MTSDESTTQTRRNVLKLASLSAVPVVGAAGGTGVAAADSTINDKEPHEVEVYEDETPLSGAPYPYDESKQVTTITTAYYGTREAPYQGGDEYGYESIFRTMLNTSVLVRESDGQWEALPIDQDDPWAEIPTNWTLTKSDLTLELVSTDGHVDDSGLNSAVKSSWGESQSPPTSEEVLQNLAGIVLGEVPILGDALTIAGIAGAFESGANEYTDGETKRHFLWQFPVKGDSIHTANYTYSVFHPVIRGFQFKYDYYNDLPNGQADTDHEAQRGFNWDQIEYPDDPEIPR